MKLIAIDMDGTLLNEYHKISDENKAVLLEAVANGHIVTIATGRNYLSARRILDEAQLDLPVIGNNGGTIHYNGELLFENVLSVRFVEETLRYIEDNELFCMVGTTEGVYIRRTNMEHLRKEERVLVPEHQARIERLMTAYEQMQQSTNVYKPYDDYRELLLSSLQFYKVYITSFHEEKLQRLEKHFSQYAELYVTSSGKDNREIMPYASQKGFGLQRLADHLNIPIEHTVAIGDNYNDVPMFRVAGTSIAMGNASDDIKHLTSCVTKTNVEHGVAHAIREFVLK